jgi:hypothetical protein
MFRLSTALILFLCIALLITWYVYRLPPDYNALKAKEVVLTEKERIHLYSIRCLHYFLYLITHLYPFVIIQDLFFDVVYVITIFVVFIHWFFLDGCILSNIEQKLLDKDFVPEKLDIKGVFWNRKCKNGIIQLRESFLLVLIHDETHYWIFDICLLFGFFMFLYVVYRIWAKRGELFAEDSVEA